tara:strand:- start:9423 stop:12905 length:3483 start_codon:yes stop_codon:yes gene_type:complete
LNQDPAPTGSSSAAAETSRKALAFVATRPVAITMLFIALAVFGVVSLAKLPVDLLPEISYPTLTVRTAYPGAAPEDVEDRVSIRVQEALSTLPNLVRSSSVSRAGFSDVMLEFDWGTGMTFAVQEVRDRLDNVQLPQLAERPLILRYDPNLDPILRIGVRPPLGTAEGNEDFIRLRWVTEKRIQRALEGIDGVAAVQVRGGLIEEILVSVDPAALAAQGIDPSAIGTRLAQENLNAPSGQIREGSTEYLVRTMNEFEDVDEIKNLALEKRGEAAIRIQDVAIVSRTFAEREVVSRIDGIEAVEVAIYREAGANIVSVAERVRAAIFGTPEQAALATKLFEEGRTKAEDLQWHERQQLGQLAWDLREDVALELLSDQSTFIAAAVDDVRDAALLGSLLAIAVMWLFLRRLAATTIVALAIPISVIVTFAPMYVMDVSLNIMSLGGLALGVGMLVDNAIVVLESITRCREEGDPLARAAVRGVGEVAGAIIASTLTTVAVFAPIVFVEGIAGQIFGDQAVTVVSALLVSLLVALLFIPMLGSRAFLAAEDVPVVMAPGGVWGMRKGGLGEGLTWSWVQALPNLLTLAARLVLMVASAILYAVLSIGRLAWSAFWKLSLPIRVTFDTCWGVVEKGYPRILRAALAAPAVVALGAIALGALAWSRVDDLGLELLPEIHQGEFTAHIALSVGSPIEHSDLVFRELDREVRALDSVAMSALTVGVEADTLTREIEGDHTARLTVRMDADRVGEEAETVVVRDVRALLEAHPEVRSVDVTRPTPFALESPIAVEIRGWDLDVLQEVGDDVRSRMERVPGLADVRSSVRPGHPEARVVFDRDRVLEYGLELGIVSDFVRDQVLGKISTRLVEGDDRIDIRVRAGRDVLATVADVEELIVNPTSDQPVPLRAIADIQIVRGPAEIRRSENARAVVVTAASDGVDLGGLNQRIEASLADLSTPDGVVVEIAGQKREMEAGQRSLRNALLLAIFLVYVVMATQFESLVQPLVILFSVPLAGVGVVFALDLLSIPLSVVVFIGMILLAGIVVNNAIVLVDRINQERERGHPLNEAILNAGQARLRPILMTTATTVLGLLPLTGWLASIPWLGQFGAGEGAELRAPMGVAVIAGLITSTLLTLVVVPVGYRLMAPRVKVVQETDPYAIEVPTS